MNDADSPTSEAETGGAAGTMAPATLQAEIEAGNPVTILDVRTREDFETWHVEGEQVTVTNTPYYEFLEDEAAAVEAAPTGDPVVVVCAEGDASEYVADRLVDAGRTAVSLGDGMEGWAARYEATPVSGYDGPGTLLQYYRPATGCLSYLVVSAGEAAVIDPLRAFVDRYREDAAEYGAALVAAVDTHCHADHVSGVGSLSEDGVTGYVPAATVERGMEIAADLETVDHGETIEVGDARIEVLHTPGHTTGMTSYLLEEQVLMTGDSLFVGTVARPDLEADDDGAPAAARQLYESLHERILTLDEDTIVAGGHAGTNDRPGPTGTYTARLGTLGEEMAVLSMDEDAFVEYVLSNMPPRPANYQQIIDANLGHVPVDDEEAFRIELGPNNCAASQAARD